MKKKWSLEDAKNDAKKYSTRKEWRENSYNIYMFANRKGFLKECCTHMKSLKKSWDKESVLKEALKYSTRSEWQRKSGGSCFAAKKLGIFEQCTAHMIKNPNRFNTKWTYQDLIQDAKKYETKYEWFENSQAKYRAAKRRGIFEECVKHMRKRTHYAGGRKKKWTFEVIIKDLENYDSYKMWREQSVSAYQAATKLGIKDMIKISFKSGEE